MRKKSTLIPLWCVCVRPRLRIPAAARTHARYPSHSPATSVSANLLRYLGEVEALPHDAGHLLRGFLVNRAGLGAHVGFARLDCGQSPDNGFHRGAHLLEEAALAAVLVAAAVVIVGPADDEDVDEHDDDDNDDDEHCVNVSILRKLD